IVAFSASPRSRHLDCSSPLGPIQVSAWEKPDNETGSYGMFAGAGVGGASLGQSDLSIRLLVLERDRLGGRRDHHISVRLSSRVRVECGPDFDFVHGPVASCRACDVYGDWFKPSNVYVLSWVR